MRFSQADGEFCSQAVVETGRHEGGETLAWFVRGGRISYRLNE